MAKAAQAHEPSMEEILASIRRIISDEDSLRGDFPAAAAVAPSVAETVPQNLWQAPAAGEEDERAVDISPVESTLRTQLPPSEEVGAARVSAMPVAPPSVDSRLLSPGVDALVNATFSQLTSTVLSSQTRTLEDLVQDMMRPMLRGWLDDNLPTLVERLVREEIERVSRGTRR